MKKLPINRAISWVLSIVLLIGIMPTGVFTANAATPTAVTYDFRLKAYAGETSVNAEDYREFPAEGSESARQWAYIGCTGSTSDTQGMYASLQVAGYMQLTTFGENEWAAFKIKVPAAGTYRFDLNAYQYQNAADFSIYVAKPTEALLAQLDLSNTATWGTSTLKAGTEATYVRAGANNDLAVFSEAGTLVGTQNYWAAKGSADVGMVTKSFGNYTFDSDGEYIIFFRGAPKSPILIGTLTLVPVLEGELANAKKVYTFSKSAYTGETITDMEQVRDYPASDSASTREWAYVGTTSGSSDTKGNFAAVSSYVNFAMNKSGQWGAVKIKAPAKGMYDLSVYAYRYRNGGILDLYLVHLDDALNAVLTDEATYGTLSEPVSGIVSRTDANDNLSVFTDANKVGSMNLRSSTATMAEETLGRVNIDKEGEYVLFFRASSELTASMHALLITNVTLNGLPLESAELTLSDDALFLEETASASVKAYRSDSSEIIASAFSAADSIKFTSSNTDVATIDEETGAITAVGVGETEITATVTYASVEKTATKKLTVSKNYTLASAEVVLSKNEVFEESAITASVSALSTENESIPSETLEVEFKLAEGSDADIVTINGANITANKVGTVDIYATVSYNGGSVDTPAVTLTVKELKRDISGTTVEYKMHTGAYAGESGSAMSEYTEYPAEDSESTRQWAYIGSTATGADPAIMLQGGFMQIASEKIGQYAAIKIKVPAAGLYRTSIYGYSRNRAGIISMYVAPLTDAAEADPTSACVPANFVDDYDFFDGNNAQFKTVAGGDLIIPEAGEYIVVFMAEKLGDGYPANALAMYPGILTLNGASKFGNATLFLTSNSIYLDESSQASVSAYLEDKTEIKLDPSMVRYVSSNPEIATVDEITGKITPVAPGTTRISVTLTIDGVTKIASKELTVKKPIELKSVTLSAPTTLAINSVGQASVSGLGTLKEQVDIMPDQVVFKIIEQSADNVITLASDGSIRVNAMGTATIGATVTYGSQVIETNTVTITASDRVGSDESVILHFDATTLGESTGHISLYPQYTTLRRWSYVDETLSNANSSYCSIQSGFGQFVIGQSGEYIALKVSIPAAGEYVGSLHSYCRYRSVSTDMYLFPYNATAASNIPAYMTEENRFATVDTYSSANAYLDFDAGSFYAGSAGDYILVMKLNSARTGTDAFYPVRLTFTGTNALSKVEATTDKEKITLGETAQITPKLYSYMGNELSADNINITYTSTTPGIATVDSNGVITGVSEGTANINIRAQRGSTAASCDIEVFVEDTSELLSVEIGTPGEIWTDGTKQLTTYANMASGNKIPIPADQVTYEVVSATPENAATVTESGFVTGVEVGSVTVIAKTGFKNKESTSAELVIPIVFGGEVNPAITTMAQREIIRENIANYGWANDEAEATIKKADVFAENYEKIYDLIVGENLPRYYHVGHKYDPDKFTCRYCGADIGAKYGSYAWIVDALNTPWKIQCPDCRRYFPSNDFGGFYELGLDEHGYFQYDQALAKNAELVANGEDGYLKNLLYPEKGEGWGVDDGFGYKPGTIDINGNEVKHTYIAFYLHAGLWYGWEDSHELINNAILSLADAYVYTGDIKYGRAGVILLDRVADFFPDFEWARWQQFRGDSYKGKITDIVWACQDAQQYCKAYDSLLPAYTDTKAVEFLSEKAVKYNLDNDKSSPMKLRQNVEDRLLRETLNDAVVGNLAGNFGMTQAAVANAAIALNTMPETGEWLEWLMRPGEPNTNPRTGGKINYQLITNVDRDGNGNEAAPGYNSLWPENLIDVAELLANYTAYPAANLYDNPKFAKMFTAQIPLILGGNYIVHIGDSGSAGGIGIQAIDPDTLIRGYQHIKDDKLAQLLYIQNGNTSKGLRYPINVKNPESLESEVQEVIDRIGELNLTSTLSAGYGFAALREGKKYAPGAYTEHSTMRDFAIYFGRGIGHGHSDALSLHMTAFGLNMAPDLGYPEQTGTQPNRIQWVDATLSHNTVLVSGKNQTALNPHGTPLHFDDSGRVKVMDIDATKAYPDIDMYRRTFVMVEVDDKVSYGVDFFRVDGGDDHIYSFHSMSNDIFETENLDMVAQVDEETGEYVGSYAGADVPWGQDPKTIVTSSATDYLQYPPGFTWLYNVRRDDNPSQNFAVDFAVTDFRDAITDDENLHLRLTMVNPFELTELALAKGNPPFVKPSPFEYLLARRTAEPGDEIDSLFTTVYEPYQHNRYIEKIEPAELTVLEEGELLDDTAHAVKVTHTSGRVDYIVYANDNSVLYRVDDTFNFRGVIGVYSIKDGLEVYSYVNDGDVIGDYTGLTSEYTGKVSDFTRELQLENEITVTLDQDIDPELLVGKWMYIETDGAENGAYEIKGVTKTDDGVVLDIGDITLVRAYMDKNAPEKGWIYNISSGAEFRIPLATMNDPRPIFDAVPKKSVEAGSELKFQINAESPNGLDITYSAGSLPRGAQFDAATQTFSWIPDAGQVGANHASFVASDGTLESTLHVEIEVHNATGGTSGAVSNPSMGTGGPTTTPDDGKTDEENPDDSGNTGDTDDKTKRFIDLGNHKWAEDAIYRLVDLGVINGTSENTYSPGNAITRADFTTLIVRAFGFTADTTENFPDVESGKYYTDTIAIAKALGIVNGDGKGNFNPMASITRQDMMVIIARAASVAGIDLSGDVENSFPDMDKVSDYAKDAVELLISSGIIAGSNGKINPLGTTTRAEVAVVLERLIFFGR